MIALLAAFSVACSNEDNETVVPEETEPVTETSAIEAADPASFPDVVATVNGVDIEKSALMKQVAGVGAQAPPEQDTTSAAFFRGVLDELVGGELLFQASKQRDLTADEAAVEQQLSTLKARFPDQTVFEQALAQQGLTLDELETQLARDLSIQNLIDADITPRISVSEKAIRKFYDENPERMRQPDQLQLSHILKMVAPDATAEIKQAAEAAITTILEQARAGADFAELAREHSEDPGSAQNGGELVVSRGETVPPFEQAAFALEPGGLSPVVETQFGFHIIKLSQKIEGQPVPYEQVQPRIEEFLKQQAVQEEVGNTVESLKEAGAVELFI